jgi:hypothetical protein
MTPAYAPIEIREYGHRHFAVETTVILGKRLF